MNHKFDKQTNKPGGIRRTTDAPFVSRNQTRARNVTPIRLACALVLSLVSAHASTYLQVDSRVAGGPAVVSSLTDRSDAPVDLHTTTNYAMSYSYGSYTASADARGRAEVGALHLQADGAVRTDSTGALVSSWGQSEAVGSWDDNFTLNADPAHFGKLGSMTVTIDISGGLSLDGDVSSSVTFQTFSQFTDSYGTNNIVQGGTRIYVDTSGVNQIQSLNGALIGPGSWQRTVYFHFGRPMYVKVWGSATATADADAYAPGKPHMDA
jgi:hypothetical protein